VDITDPLSGEKIPKVQYRMVIAGNQCKPKGSLVMTPSGPVAIEYIKVGDIVYDEHGKEIKVLETHQNGIKSVVEIIHRGTLWGESTLNHVWMTKNSSSSAPKKELALSDFSRDTQIVRQTVHAPLGNVNIPEAYAIGAMLGDGCCTCGSDTRLVISGNDEPIISKVAEQFKGTYYKASGNNYNWNIRPTHTPRLYTEWCKDKRAHEKIVNLEEIHQWNRASLLSYVAGVVDTDGSVFLDSWDTVTIQVSMQARTVIESLQYAFLALWQVPVSITLDNRPKYKKGPVYCIKVANNAFSLPMLKELSTELVVERKRWKAEYEQLSAKRTNPNAIGVKLGNSREVETYDLTVDSPTNLYLTSTGLVTHNSGKSSVAAREIAWIVNENHPTWKRPDRWGEEPLLIIVAGQGRQQMEAELWGKKIKPFLEQSEWEEKRVGGILNFVVHKRKGHKIMFLSHNESSESARQHMQGYVAHYVWLDEMPRHLSILEELQRRVDARKGYLIATFTPKATNESIRKIVEVMVPPIGKRYRLSKLDNPLYAKQREVELQKLHGYSDAWKNTVLYGDWHVGDEAVYDFNADFAIVDEIPHYSASWRHVVSVDPALKSKFGFTEA
jgi:phage terminase large subunit-like protein